MVALGGLGMTRTDRRQRTALDEAYRYYNKIESQEEPLELYRLVKAVRTLSFALAFSDTGEFKLTRQLWKRLHQALFDRLINNFSGTARVFDENHDERVCRRPFPESGYLEFYPDGCKRADDANEIELSRLYPKTASVVKRVWEERGAHLLPRDFVGGDCEGGVCFMRPLVTGHEVLCEESRKGRDEAYHRWWELYWDAYCTADRRCQEAIMRQMYDLESVWGNLYY